MWDNFYWEGRINHDTSQYRNTYSLCGYGDDIPKFVQLFNNKGEEICKLPSILQSSEYSVRKEEQEGILVYFPRAVFPDKTAMYTFEVKKL